MPPSPVRGSFESRAMSSSAQPPFADQLERLSARLDPLIRDARLGSRSHRETERIIGEVEAIAIGLWQAARGKDAVLPGIATSGARPVNPPLMINGNKAAW